MRLDIVEERAGVVPVLRLIGALDPSTVDPLRERTLDLLERDTPAVAVDRSELVARCGPRQTDSGLPSTSVGFGKPVHLPRIQRIDDDRMGVSVGAGKGNQLRRSHDRPGCHCQPMDLYGPRP